MDERITEILKSVGLTDGESKIYFALISLGTSTVGPIVESSEVSASKVYQILNKLMAKGLISMTVQQKKRIYTALSPDKLIGFLDEEKKRIENNKEKVQGILPALNNLRGEHKESLPVVEITEGRMGFRQFHDEIIESAKEGESYMALASHEIGFRFQGLWYDYSVRMSNKKIHQYIIYGYDQWQGKDPQIHKRKKRKYYYPKVFIEKVIEFPTIVIVGNKTVISDVGEKNNVFSIIIRDKNLTFSLKKLVKLIYDIGNFPKGFEKKELNLTQPIS